MTSDVKITKFDKTPNTTLYTTPVTPPSTPSKPVICNMQNIIDWCPHEDAHCIVAHF